MEEKLINGIVFKKIKNFPNYYISKCGKIYSTLRNKFLKCQLNSNGYFRVSLGREKKIYLHQLIAETFIKKIDNTKNCINHINGKKTDNSIENLEWCTYSENLKHKFRILKYVNSKPLLGFNNFKNPASKQFIYKNKLYGSFKEFKEKNNITDYKLNKLSSRFKFISRNEYIKIKGLDFSYKGKAHH